MKTTYKMKEATNVKEAITSILDVLKENPLWLNKCTGDLSIILQNCSEALRPLVLESATKDVITDLYVEFKSKYYDFQEKFYEPKKFEKWNY